MSLLLLKYNPFWPVLYPTASQADWILSPMPGESPVFLPDPQRVTPALKVALGSKWLHGADKIDGADAGATTCLKPHPTLVPAGLRQFFVGQLDSARRMPRQPRLLLSAQALAILRVFPGAH